MSEPFVGEIRMFAGNFQPRGWAFCDGQLLSVSSNDALFSLLGTIYGGDGRTTFGLPDLRGRLPIHAGSGPGLSPRPVGARGGAERVTLTSGQVPAHTHALQGTTASAASRDPGGNLLAAASTVTYVEQDPDGDMKTDAIVDGPAASSHENRMPALCLHFIIALVGIYPSRT